MDQIQSARYGIRVNLVVVLRAAAAVAVVLGLSAAPLTDLLEILAVRGRERRGLLGLLIDRREERLARVGALCRHAGQRCARRRRRLRSAAAARCAAPAAARLHPADPRPGLTRII